MYKRAHHQRIETLLSKFDGQFLRAAGARFGGGTAIALLLNEYRESVDVDFIIADKEGYRQIRETVSSNSLGELSAGGIELLRDVRWDRDKLSFFAVVEGAPIKVEFVLEGRIELLKPDVFPSPPIPLLAREDMFAEKLLANADRGLDESVLSRDIIDLGMMIAQWGPIPEGAIERAMEAYGQAIPRYFDKAVTKLENEGYRKHCLRELSMDPELGLQLVHDLRRAEEGLTQASSPPRFGR